MGAAFCAIDPQHHQRQPRPLYRDGSDDPDTVDQADRVQARQVEPPRQVDRTDHRTDDEERKCHQHAQVAGADGKQRARATASTQLHAQAEHEGAHHQRGADGRHRPHHAGLTAAEQRNHQRRGQCKQDQLGTHAGAATLGDQIAPAGGKAKGPMVERHPQRDTDAEQRHQERSGLEPHQPAQDQHPGQGHADDETIDRKAALDGGRSGSLCHGSDLLVMRGPRRRPGVGGVAIASNPAIQQQVRHGRRSEATTT